MITRSVHVLIVSGDGARRVGLNVPRVVIRSAAFVALGVMIGVGGVIADDIAVRRARQTTAALEQQLGAQQQVNARLHAQFETVRSEVSTWPALEREILAPFDRSTASADTAASSAHDGDDVVTATHRSTGALRDVAGVMTRLHDTLARLPSESPVHAAINSPFGSRQSPWTGEREFHRGVDIAAHEGVPVRAPARGDVVFTGGRGDYGLTVIVEHGAGVRTLYGHLSRVSVRQGERIERGQIVGRSGRTGRSTGVHLHYEVQVSGRPVDPRPFLWN